MKPPRWVWWAGGVAVVAALVVAAAQLAPQTGAYEGGERKNPADANPRPDQKGADGLSPAWALGWAYGWILDGLDGGGRTEEERAAGRGFAQESWDLAWAWFKKLFGGA